jgi:sugar phosphate isomerase/epimerase
MSNLKIEGAHVTIPQMQLLQHAAKKPNVQLAAAYLRQAFPGYAVESGATWLKLIAPAGNPVAVMMLRDVQHATK